MAREYRINEQIRGTPEVRVIDEKGQPLGVMALYQALQHAREAALDLVEVAPTAQPPVCRVLDYGKFKYEQAKKEREARKHQRAVDLSEVRMRPGINEHDIQFKIRLIGKLLQDGNKVKISVIFRGREITHPELGARLLKRIAAEVKEQALLERAPGQEGRNLMMVLAPSPTAGKQVAKPVPVAQPAVTEKSNA